MAVAAMLSFGLGAAAGGEKPDPPATPTIRDKGSAPLPKPVVPRLADRAACSSLCQAKHPTDEAFRTMAGLGFKWIDLSCLSWARHVSVPALLENFEQEAVRVEKLLSAHRLKVANLTFDSFEGQPFDAYERQFQAVVKLAARWEARLINLMAPAAQSDREEMVVKLKKLQALAANDGVILTVETHCNQITERPADALWLCRQVPGLGLTLDPSHYYAGPHQGAGFDELYPLVQGTGFRAGATSWKDIQMPWGEGPINFRSLVRQLEARGYQGFYAAEYIEGFNQLDAVEESRKFLEWMKGL